MSIYIVKNDYIDFLNRCDSHVMWSKDDSGHPRPYVGIIFEINEFVYFAPLTHNGKRWKSFDDHIVLENGNIGAIKFPRMIPVAKANQNELIAELVYKNLMLSENIATKKYGYLIRKQYWDIKRQWNSILNLAYKVYFEKETIKRKSPYYCDFKKLEKRALLYNKSYLYLFKIIKMQKYNIM